MSEQRARPIIAIDGPSGVGKSTLAGRLAHSLSFTKLDTGAMYRALALAAVDGDFDLNDAAALGDLAARTNIRLEPGTHSTRVLLNGHDVSLRVRDADITQAASRVSVHPEVRVWLVRRQQEIGRQGGIVMEGRDIGTVVFPDAEIKFFLDAKPEVRGERRFLQQEQLQTDAGKTASLPGNTSIHAAADATASGPERSVQFENAVRLIKERDARDRERNASPLVAAPDAVLLETSEITQDQVLAQALQIVQQRFPELPVRPA